MTAEISLARGSAPLQNRNIEVFILVDDTIPQILYSISSYIRAYINRVAYTEFITNRLEIYYNEAIFCINALIVQSYRHLLAF